jgi:hypothetical protein
MEKSTLIPWVKGSARTKDINANTSTAVAGMILSADNGFFSLLERKMLPIRISRIQIRKEIPMVFFQNRKSTAQETLKATMVKRHGNRIMIYTLLGLISTILSFKTSKNLTESFKSYQV